MELKINMDYSQILNIIQQLPLKEIEKLTSTLQTEVSLNKENSKKKLGDLILSAPTWTESEYSDYLEARNQINKTRLI